MLFPVPSVRRKVYLRLLRWRIILRHVPVFHRPAVRRFFHWQSVVLIPSFWGTALTLVGIGVALEDAAYLFKWAYFFCVCGFIWSVGCWLTSEALEKKNRPTRRQRRGLEPYSRASFICWQWVVTALIIGGFVGALAFVHRVELAKDLRSLKGRLFPGDDPTTYTCGSQKPPEGAVIVLLGAGDSSLVRKFPHLVIWSRKFGPVLQLERADDGSIAIVMDIRSADGRIVVSLNRDGFVVNQNNILEMKRADRSSLIVVDQEGKEVLNARYLNAQAFSLTGTLRYPGRSPMPIELPGLTNICVSTNALPGVFDIEIP